MDLVEQEKQYRDFQERLNAYFIRSDKEWVDVFQTATGRLDLTIVSNRFVEDREEAIKYIESQLEFLAGYEKGFTTYHSIEDAELLGLKKPQQAKVSEASWTGAVLARLNSDAIKCEEKKHRSRVISFYSYKGGVGRTIALIQCAYLLAQRGKKVVLLDLDIEAPSLQEIFRDQIDVKHGLIDFLYEQIVVDVKDRKLKATDIFSEIHFAGAVSGSVYVIPAGQLSLQYVQKLSVIQPRIVSRNDYVTNLLVELEQRLNIDTVLIDSRTGLNDWGAFSLFGFADDILLFAYPNYENVFGLKLIIDLIQSAGCKNVTTVFSRVEKDGGEERAIELFKILNIEQEFLSIIYNPRLAVAKTLPVEEALSEYRKIADFLLENESYKINQKYLSENGRKDNLIRSALYALTERSSVTGVEYKARQKNYSFIVGNNAVLHTRMKPFLLASLTYLINEKPENLPRKIQLGNSVSIDDELARTELEELVHDKVDLDWNSLWLAYFLYMLNQIPEKKITGIPELKGNSLKHYIQFVENSTSEYIYGVLERSLLSEDATRIEPNSNDSTNLFLRRTYLILTDITYLDREFYADKQWLQGLIGTIDKISREIEPLYIKVLVPEEYYQSNRTFFADMKGNTLQLEWKRDGLIDFMRSLFQQMLSEEVWSEFVYAIQKTQSYETFLKGLEEYQVKEDAHISLFPFTVLEEETNSNLFSGLLNLFWGRRIQPGIYSKTFTDWFYEKLIETYEVITPIQIGDILKKALAYELNNDENRSAILSKDSVEKAFQDLSTRTI